MVGYFFSVDECCVGLIDSDNTEFNIHYLSIYFNQFRGEGVSFIGFKRACGYDRECGV